MEGNSLHDFLLAKYKNLGARLYFTAIQWQNGRSTIYDISRFICPSLLTKQSCFYPGRKRRRPSLFLSNICPDTRTIDCLASSFRNSLTATKDFSGAEHACRRHYPLTQTTLLPTSVLPEYWWLRGIRRVRKKPLQRHESLDGRMNLLRTRTAHNL